MLCQTPIPEEAFTDITQFKNGGTEARTLQSSSGIHYKQQRERGTAIVITQQTLQFALLSHLSEQSCCKRHSEQFGGNNLATHRPAV